MVVGRAAATCDAPNADGNDKVTVIDLPLQRDIFHPPFMRVSTPAYEEAAAARLAELHAAGRRQQWKYMAAKPSQSAVRVIRRGWWDTAEAATPQPSLPWWRKGSPPSTRNGNDNDGNVQSPCHRLLYTILELQPYTGRTHQLRVHCAALGFPILGDATYGWHGEAAPRARLQGVPSTNLKELDDDSYDNLQESWEAAWPPNVAPLCLHAMELQLAHPHPREDIPSGQPVDVHCRVEAPFEQWFMEHKIGDEGN